MGLQLIPLLLCCRFPVAISCLCCMCCLSAVCRAYRGLALKHHPDKALQHCRWSPRLGKCGAAAAHVTAPSGGVEASLKAAANEVFGFLSAAHEELVNAASRSKVRCNAASWVGAGVWFVDFVAWRLRRHGPVARMHSRGQTHSGMVRAGWQSFACLPVSWAYLTLALTSLCCCVLTFPAAGSRPAHGGAAVQQQRLQQQLQPASSLHLLLRWPQGRL